MKFCRLLLLYSLCFSLNSFAEASLDDEIFGHKEEIKEQQKPQPTTTRSILTEVKETTTLGGRVEIETLTYLPIGSELKDVRFQHQSTIESYLDAKPNDAIRGFMRLRGFQPYLVNNSPDLHLDLDEAWVKIIAEKKLFITYGRQHMKWGAAKFWNPSDFLASSVRNPLVSYDIRLGSDILKIHFPLEKESTNLYAILQVDNLQTNNRPGAALRAEFVVGPAEYSFSAYTRKNDATKFASDISSALGPLDVYAEYVLSFNYSRQFYKTAPTLTGYEAYSRKKDWFQQLAAGTNYTMQIFDKNQIIMGLEYFYNGLGYDKRLLEFASVINGDSSPLYLGRNYLGLYAQLPNPGSWTQTTFSLNTIGNLSDDSFLSRLSCQTKIYKEAILEIWGSAAFGSTGEFRFTPPEELLQNINNKNPSFASALALGTGVSRALGANLSLKF